jgi:hypothetical protein
VKKRGNGEGSVFKRKDGRWCARYTVRTVNGLNRRDVYGETRKEVVGKLREALDESHRGSVRTSENLGDFLRYWLANSVSGSVSPRTYERYEQIVRLHIEPALEHASVLVIVPGDHVVTARCEGCGTYGNPSEFSEVSLGGRKGAYSGVCQACAREVGSWQDEKESLICPPVLPTASAQSLWLGPDSLVVLLTYIGGVLLLTYVPGWCSPLILPKAARVILRKFYIYPLGEMWQWVKTDHPTGHYPAQNFGERRPQRERR